MGGLDGLMNLVLEMLDTLFLMQQTQESIQIPKIRL
mgnify:CR=1 FL=1